MTHVFWFVHQSLNSTLGTGGQKLFQHIFIHWTGYIRRGDRTYFIEKGPSSDKVILMDFEVSNISLGYIK